MSFFIGESPLGCLLSIAAYHLVCLAGEGGSCLSVLVGGGVRREAVLGGRHYWEGGGIGRKAVLGGRRYCEGGGIGRDDCISEEGDPQLRALS